MPIADGMVITTDVITCQPEMRLRKKERRERERVIECFWISKLLFYDFKGRQKIWSVIMVWLWTCCCLHNIANVIYQITIVIV